MCTAVVAQEILDSLQARIDNKSVFSAFDVTTDARDRTDDRISHRDVRNIVHNEFNTGQFPDDYNQDVIELDVPNNPQVIVYFPDGKSALDHPKALQPAPIATAPTGFAATSSQSSTPTKTRKGGKTKDGDSYVCKATSEGRISIPYELLVQVKTQGGSYDIAYYGKTFYKKPNADGRVRIRTSELDNGTEFKIAVDTTYDTIVIEKI